MPEQIIRFENGKAVNVDPALWLKEQAIRIADHHRATCPGETCTVTLSSLADLLRRAGIVVSQAEFRHFI
jgi:hypothetical protein